MRTLLTERCDGAPRVLVVVRDGCVVSVLSEEPCEVGIVDFDCQGAGPEHSEAFGGWHDSGQWENIAPEVKAAIEGVPDGEQGVAVLMAAFPEANPADLDDVRSLAGEFYRVRKGEGRAKHETVTAAFYEACRAIGAIGNLADGQLYIRPVDENALPTGPRIYIPEVQG